MERERAKQMRNSRVMCCDFIRERKGEALAYHQNSMRKIIEEKKTWRAGSQKTHFI